MTDAPVVVRLTGSFEVEVTDEAKLRAANLDALQGPGGEFEGVMDFTLERKVALRLNELVTAMGFWEVATEALGVRIIVGGLMPRLRRADDSYPAQELPEMRADGTLNFTDDV